MQVYLAKRLLSEKVVGGNHNVTSHTGCSPGTPSADAEVLKIIFQVSLTNCHPYRFQA